MTFRDWATESARRFRTKPLDTAATESVQAFGRGIFRRVGAHLGESIWARNDWDVLVILDACRHDLWDDVAPEYGLPTGTTVWSNASCSIDFYERNFAGRGGDLSDVGLVTANPFADHSADHARSADLRDEPLAHFRPLYETEWQKCDTDPPIETVPPERVTDHAIDAWRHREELRIDQLVVHYMQPHEPFRARPEWSYQNPEDSAVLKNLVSEDYQAGTSPWQAMVDSGEVTPEEFWPVYCDNLRWVLDDVTERLLGNMDGEIVFSADHGNGLGEWGEWHHPPGAIGPAVRKVPWESVHSEDGGRVQPDVAGSEREAVGEAQLEALGYV